MNQRQGDSSSLLLVSKRGSRQLIVEVDEIAAYAYLVDVDSGILGDVWLYNVGETPAELPWRVPGALPPFKNPASHCRTDISLNGLDLAKLTAEWSGDTVWLMLERQPLARLEPGSSPGWCLLASHPGPCARPLAENEFAGPSSP